jgi:hypothetical protein
MAEKPKFELIEGGLSGAKKILGSAFKDASPAELRDGLQEPDLSKLDDTTRREVEYMLSDTVDTFHFKDLE